MCIYHSFSIQTSPHWRTFGFSQENSHSSPHACLGKGYVRADRMMLFPGRTDFLWVLCEGHSQQVSQGITAFPSISEFLSLLEGDASNLCPEKSGSKYASRKTMFYPKKGRSLTKITGSYIYLWIRGWMKISEQHELIILLCRFLMMQDGKRMG